MEKILSIFSLVLLMVVSGFSTTINIPADYPTIQEGIDASIDGDTVLIAQGIYYENLMLEKEIVIASYAINDDLDSEWLNNENIQETIISGAQEPIDPNKGSCLIIRDGNIQPTIMGLTFKDGIGTSLVENDYCAIEINRPELSGGAILIYKAYPTIIYNRFIDNGQETDNVRAGKGGRTGGAIGHYSDDDVEFDEDRRFSNQSTNPTRDIPDTLNITNNYFENNYSGDGKNFYSRGYEGLIDVSYSIFDDIDCVSNSVNKFVLKSRNDYAEYLQNDISGNCIEENSFYVSIDGDNNNPGTESHPLKTVGHALSLVINDSTITTTIYIGEGTFSPSTTGEQFPISIPDNVHLIGINRETSILNAESDQINQSRVLIIERCENIRIEKLTITGGNAENAGCFGGGGIYICPPNPSFFDWEITPSTPILKDLVVKENHAYAGGGISIWEQEGPILTNIIISGNTASWLGGGIMIAASIATLTNINLSNNKALDGEWFGNNWFPGCGGGVYMDIGEATMSRIQILNNTGEHGAGICVMNESHLYLTSSTLYGNTSDYGGSINSIAFNGSVSITNSIFRGNFPTDVTLPYSLSTIRYSNIDWNGEGNINVDPLFIDPENEDFNLQLGSPCIDAGIADLDGDGTEDIGYVGSAPDMGAFEFGGILGCTDPEADNYDSEANMDDGTCVFGPPEITVSYNTGWNIVGLPMEVEDASYETLFLNAYEGSLYSFSDIYDEQDELVAGNGYLLRMTSADSVTFTGTPIYSVTVPVAAGWNLFSGTSSSHSVEDMYANEIIYSGTVYGLDANYYNPENIEPGRGYWVRATEDGEITLTSDGSAKQVPFVNRMDGANSISFSTENYSTDLYFGIDVPEEEWLSYSLPPTFPQMAFDVRFSGDTKLVPESGQIEVITQSEMITIEYDIKVDAEERMSWIFRTGSGKDYTLEGIGELTVPSEKRFTLELRAVIPATFTLHQNFPNPFNPITTLRYDLSSDALVTLSIYDMLGREVTQLVNTTQEAGFRSVQWDATDSMGRPVSAGVYLYQIQAGEFVQTRKMVLLK